MGMGRLELIELLKIPQDREKYLFELSAKTRKEGVGDKVYLRGLIELGNICIKNCLYCGIRKDNKNADRYTLTDKEVFDAAEFAYNNRYGSIAIQSGELESKQNTDRITRLIEEIKTMSNGEIGITLSLGEQSFDTYKRWKEAGADRYLLRIETSNEELFNKIHPNDSMHSYSRRIESLHSLKKLDYQVGTGIMIGLPNQSIESLADDLLFFKETDIDMCGMGPYLNHADALLGESNISEQERFSLTLRMIAILRIMMPKINIAATTALQAINPLGRELALKIGANVIMPNITPNSVRKNYKLYENKPISEDCLDIQEKTLFDRINDTGLEIGFSQQGNSVHYNNKKLVL